MTRPRVRDPIVDELVDYFRWGDAAQGLSSSWGPLVAICVGGFGGSPDPEKRIDDRRFGLGPHARSRVGRAREVRAALLTLAPAHQAALWARWGPTPWGRIIDAAFEPGTNLTVEARLGDLAAAALLTPGVAEGYEVARATLAKRAARAKAKAKGAEKKRAAKGPPEEHEAVSGAWDNPGGYLVSLCLDRSGDASKTLAKIRDEAAALLAAAEAAYRHARPVPIARPRAPRRPSFDPFARPTETP